MRRIETGKGPANPLDGNNAGPYILEESGEGWMTYNWYGDTRLGIAWDYDSFEAMTENTPADWLICFGDYCKKFRAISGEDIIPIALSRLIFHRQTLGKVTVQKSVNRG